MKTIVKILFVAGIACAAPFAHADKTVTFNVPVKLEKLDPAVKSAFMYCAIQGPNNWNVIESGPLMIIANGGYVGINSVKVSVKDADLGKAKSWNCYLRFKQNTDPSSGANVSGPNNPSNPWSAVAPGAVESVSGTF